MCLSRIGSSEQWVPGSRAVNDSISSVTKLAISFTPGFSPVIYRHREGKPFKRFPDWSLADTGLKPGVSGTVSVV